MKKRKMLTSGSAGAVTEILQLGARPGELVRISEPGSAFHLTCGTWKSQYHEMASEISPYPGCYVMMTPPVNGVHLVYVGESGSVVGRLGWHQFARNNRVCWFCVLASSDPAWTKTHALLLQSDVHHWFVRGVGTCLYGKEPSDIRVGERDRYVGTQAMNFLRRVMSFGTLPASIGLPDEHGHVHTPIVELEGGQVLQVYESWTFSPGPNCAYADIRAILSETSAGFMLHGGSEMRTDTSRGLPPSIHRVRRALQKRGLVEQVRGTPGRMRIKVPVIISTRQVAARVISGYPIPSLPVWEPISAHPLCLNGV